jgi:nucleoside-diphosphate-sugar epimerase
MFALVTGSTGFLGLHLVEHLRMAGHRVRALVYGPYQPGSLEAGGSEVVCGDITEPRSVELAMEGIDVVFHAAALVTNWAPWSRFLATTVRGTENVLAAAARARVRRFVHISTIRVYDDRYCRRYRLVTEDAPQGKRGFRHFGHYARAKVMAEAAVWRYQTRLPVSIIRPAWMYGPGDQTIIPPLLHYLSGPGGCWPCRSDACADPIYVSDVAQCALTAATHPGAIGQAYNAAPPRRIGVRAFLGALGQALGLSLPERSAPYVLAHLAASASEWWARLARPKAGPAYHHAGLAILSQDVRHSPAKAQRELNWHPQVELADGVRATAAWIAERYPDLGGVPSFAA